MAAPTLPAIFFLNKMLAHFCTSPGFEPFVVGAQYTSVLAATMRHTDTPPLATPGTSVRGLPTPTDAPSPEVCHGLPPTPPNPTYKRLKQKSHYFFGIGIVISFTLQFSAAVSTWHMWDGVIKRELYLSRNGFRAALRDVSLIASLRLSHIA